MIFKGKRKMRICFQQTREQTTLMKLALNAEYTYSKKTLLLCRHFLNKTFKVEFNDGGTASLICWMSGDSGEERGEFHEHRTLI